MNETKPDRRRHPRHDIAIHASLQAAGVVVPCRVHNISAAGALIEAGVHLRIGDRASLTIPHLRTVAGSVARVSSTTMGIAFEDSEETMGSFIAEWLALSSDPSVPGETAPAD